LNEQFEKITDRLVQKSKAQKNQFFIKMAILSKFQKK